MSSIEPSISFDDLKWRRSHDFVGSVGSEQWECNFGNAILETPVTSMIHDQLTNNPLKMGIIEPYRGIIHPFRGIIQPFRGIIKPFRGIIQPSRGITEPLTFRGIIQPNVRRIFLPNRSSGRNDLHDSAHWEEPECLIVNKERKQRILVQKIVRNTFTKAIPGYHEHVISNPANIRSLNERQSRQCLHFKQVKLYRKRNREPSRVPSKVLKLMKHRKLRSKIKRCLKESVPISSVFFSIATNYKLWIIKVAVGRSHFSPIFSVRNFNEKVVGHLDAILIIIQYYCTSPLTIRISICQKKSFYYLEM